MTGGEVLVRALAAEGVELAFGIPGGEMLPFLEAMDRLECGVAYVGVRHEQAAAFMADAATRVSGKPAVACGTVGPGFVNMLAGTCAAWADNVPVLLVHPVHDRVFEDHGRYQSDIDQLAMARPVVKYQKNVDDPDRVAWAVRKCFKALHSGRPGPVQLEVREDAFHGETSPRGRVVLPPERYRATDPPAGNPAAVNAACELLLEAQRPLVVSGGGVTLAGCWNDLRALCVDYRLPVGTTFRGMGTASTDVDVYVGATVGTGGMLKAAREADVVLALGTKFSYVLAYGQAPVWNPDAKLIQVDVDPQMLGKNRPVDVAILGDVGVVLKQLRSNLMARGVASGTAIGDPGWLPALREAREQNVKAVWREMTSDKVPILPQRLVHDFFEFLQPEDVVALDGGDVVNFALSQIDYVKPRGPRTVLHSSGFGHLGTAIPYAIGAKLAAPERDVYFLTGDGSYLFSIGELDTAVRYRVPFVGVVADNQAWGMIKNKERRTWGRKRGYFCVDLPSDDACSNYVRITEGFGCHAESVVEPSEIKPALQRALDWSKANERPAVVVVPVKFVEPANASLLASLRKLM